MTRIQYAEPGFDPTEHDFPLEGPNLRGCLMIILLIWATLATIGFVLTTNARGNAAPSGTNTATPTPMLMSERSATRSDKTNSQTPSPTPTKTPTNTAVPNATLTMTQTPTMTPSRTITPSRTPKPVIHRQSGGSASSGAANQDGCGPCSGSVSITISENGPSGPPISATEFSIATQIPPATSGAATP